VYARGVASKASLPSAGFAPSRIRWAVWGAAGLLGIGAGIGIVVAHSSGKAKPMPLLGGPAVTWAAGARPAPAFTLMDERGKPVSLAAYRGRPVLVTFMDPLCTTFCPLESKVVDRALSTLPAASRPAVLAVSVNPPNDQQAKLEAAMHRFRWLPQWRWAVGDKRSLAAVWRSYSIAVLPTKGDVTHTEAVYFVDSKGYERQLFIWPFRTADLVPALQQLH
jgi:cytochrome oxidase Cu insertion factor (SCO1/SenC/PrrC family)